MSTHRPVRESTAPARLALTALLTGAALLVPSLLAPPAAAQATATESPCATPRAAAATFLDNLQADQNVPRQAIRCFQKPAKMDQDTLIARVKNLKAVLDARGHFVDFDLLPVKGDYENAQGEPRIPLVPTFDEIVIRKIGEEWLFPASVVERIPDLYNETFSGFTEALIAQLPPMFRTQVLGFAVWQVVGIGLFLLIALLISRVTRMILEHRLARLLQRMGIVPPETLLRDLGRPLGWLAGAALFLVFLPELRLGIGTARILAVAARVIAAGSAALLGYRLVDLVAVFLANRAAQTDTKMDDQLVVLVRKTLRVIVVGIGLVFVLQNLSVDVTSLLAGLGIGGLALALAAKDTAANLFGSFTIFIDAPFYVGDWIKVAGVEGTVMEIGLRSTRVRTFASSVVSVPNSTLATATIENFSRREYRRFTIRLGVAYHTTTDQLEAFVEGIRAIIASHPSTRKDYYEVHLVDFADSSLQVMVYTFFTCDTWSAELAGKHQLLIAFKRLAERIGVEFAFPTRTLHIETQAEPTDRAVPPAPDDDALVAGIRAFGPDGEIDVTGRRLTHGYFPDTIGQRGSADG